MTSARVALIGAAGHGATHLRRLSDWHAAGRVTLAGVCDLNPVETPPGVPLFTDHHALLRSAEPEVVVICTPPHTHLPIAVDAARAGCDLLLEKPPVLSLAEHASLIAVLDETARACQVGFQALGSPALHLLSDAIAAGQLGTVTRVAACGAWWRPDAYFTRVPWAGRRALDGRPVLDGAVANPFAHALMDCLVLAGFSGGADLEVERYRVGGIEVDDTTCLRLAGDPEIVLAVTLRSPEFIAGDITVSGTAGTAVLEYPTDRLALPGHAEPTTVPGRVDLLDNLLAHRADPAGVPLLCPIEATGPFTAVIDALWSAPPPTTIEASQLTPRADGTAIAGISETVRRATSTGSLFAELGVAWAVPAWRGHVPTTASISQLRPRTIGTRIPKPGAISP
jgi:predicted dehydrogenase